MKHTAKNTEFLKHAKAQWSAGIYKAALHAYNEGGEAAARLLLAGYSLDHYEKACQMGIVPDGHVVHRIWESFIAACERTKERWAQNAKRREAQGL